MKKIWVDSDLLENKSGIGRDSQLMVEWLNVNFDCEVIEWPKLPYLKSNIRRKLLLGMRIVFGKAFHLPISHQGALYQSQLGPLLPGREIRVWIVRLHDLFPVTNPEWFRWWAILIFKKSLSLAVNRKAIFLCDSVSTANEVRRLYQDQTLNVFVVPCRLPQEVSLSCGMCEGCKSLQTLQENEYFLSVGTVEPRKNYPLALSTWKDIRSESGVVPNLVIVGRPGWKTQKIQKDLREATDQGVIWLSGCCDGALEKLYSQTEGLISFSLGEGFDLPAMEARQRYQKPLILSDISVHREFHDGSATFFSDKSELLYILKNPLNPTIFSNYNDSADSNLILVAAHIKSML
jgi:glycosyltransferase involved in cell wall biosynthesis